jgi:aromatic-L-amino-acid decarboxylase
VNATGQAYLTHTRIDGRYVLCLAAGAPSTTDRHAAATWKLIQAAADEVDGA